MKTILLIAAAAGGLFLFRRYKANTNCGCAGCGDGTDVPTAPDDSDIEEPVSGYLAQGGELVGDAFSRLFNLGLEGEVSPVAATPSSGGCGCA